MENNTKFIVKITPNVEGRDFFLGDLNGCYLEFNKLLDFVKFDKFKDRIFCTGNVFGRGPDSLKCLDLLNETWFFSVLGNYEDSLIQKIENKQQDVDKYKKYLPKLKELPLIYEVEHLLYGQVYIIHGEIMPEHVFNIEDVQINTKEYQRYINTMKIFDFSNQILNFFNYYKKDILDSRLKQKLLWSRKHISEFYKDNKTDIDNKDFSFLTNQNKYEPKLKLYSGHNIVPFPMKIGQQYYINTGVALAYPEDSDTHMFSQLGNQIYALSLVDITTGSCYGCISSDADKGQVMQIEKSIYEK